MKHIEYRIQTLQSSWGEHKWTYVIKKYMRVTFKRSRRVGWRSMGFVERQYPIGGFDSRAEALAHARSVREELVK